MELRTVIVVLASIATTCSRADGRRPNVIFVLTDDQDFMLNSMYSMPKTRRLIADRGLTFLNAFATTPICCPSRSSILTGVYLHNHRVVNNSIDGNCSSAEWQSGPEKKAFATYLKRLNYTTFYAGKYLNQYGMKATGGVEHIPPGWDHWFGLVGNSRYYNYTISSNGKWQHHGDDPKKDYFTNVIKGKALDFLRNQVPEKNDPFFMMLATPACHAPFTPEPKYAGNFSDLVAPRTKNYNVSNPDKHWLLRQTHYLNSDVVHFVDNVFRNRWRTLLTVDDMVEEIVNVLDKKNILNDTYIFFSSDHGYHLGQFSLPLDKRQMYETDVRIPLMVRGPGISGKQISRALVAAIDFAPTFVELAGGTPPDHMDGTSLVPLLTKPSRSWRNNVLIEYVGEGRTDPVVGCPQFASGGVGCCGPDCICEDSFNNTYVCIRTLSMFQSSILCQFVDNERFTEIYNLDLDPYQLDNLAYREQRSSLDVQKLKSSLYRLQACSGERCRAE